MKKASEVTFITNNLKEAYQELEDGKFEDKELFKFINRAKADLLENPLCGIHVPNRLIPEEYTKNYCVSNLWKYDLPDGWRLLYTLAGDELKIVAVILEWLTHKEYEQRFNY